MFHGWLDFGFGYLFNSLFPPGVAVNHFDGSGNKYEYMMFTVAESHLKERAAGTVSPAGRRAKGSGHSCFSFRLLDM
jgi:hypothetical protein